MQSLKRPLLAFAICLIFGLMGTLKAEAPAAPAKGQIKQKAVWARRRFSKKTQTNEFVLFAVKSKQNKQNKFVHSFFGRI